jgi:serine/threonine protein kinase/tetratricopeptide (TPR) repeat protein
MSTEPKSVKDIFLAAVDKPSPADRGAFLDEACAGDAALRQRVEALLKAHDEPGSLLAGPAVFQSEVQPTDSAETVAPRSSETAGSSIGPYKLLQQIGEGGMGTVWMAEQTEPVRRIVALKVIKAGMDSALVIARFEAERQALALMDHPNIAKVLDAGSTEGGRPFFVMELVKGTPITKYCDTHRLTVRQRLELFVSVCQALQHAHQKGIIHRDLKPSNVLIAPYDGRPVVKVIDFGVAKATGPRLTERTLFTEFGAMIGTLEYMSPEQAELNNLDIDTRSDIYSLGVLLYELLTGTTPLNMPRLRGAALAAILMMIQEEEPPRPSTRLSSSKDSLPSISAQRQTEPAKLPKLVRGDLDWIVMKALEKDRNRRYETANGLARDIERFLHEEPVEACPPKVGYRLRKFVRRNKGPVLAATTILLVLVGGIFGTTWGMLRAKAAARAEKQARETAEQREVETKAVLDFVEHKVFAAARPEGQEGGLGHEVLLRKAVQAALPFVEKSFTGQPLIEARLRMTMGTSFLYVGEAKTAIEQYQAARQLYTEHLGPDHPDTLKSMVNLATSYVDAGRTQEALKLREQTLQLTKAKLGPDAPDTLMSMNNLANSYADVGRTQEALQLREETLRLKKIKLGPDDAGTLTSMNNLAESYTEIGRNQEALKLHEETLQLRKVKLGPDHPDTLASMNNLANSYFAVGRIEEALKLYGETLQVHRSKLGRDHRRSLLSMQNLAICYAAAGRVQEALKLRQETLRLQKGKLGPDHPDTLWSMAALADSYDAAGRVQEALKLREETLQLQKVKLGPDHPDTLRMMNHLANSYINVREVAKAEAILQETLALRERRAQAAPSNPLEQSFLAWTHGQMGVEAERLQMDYAAAVQAYARSVAMFEKLDQAGALKDPFFPGMLNLYRQRLALCRKAEQAVRDLDFVLQQPGREVPGLLLMRLRYLLKEQNLPAAVETAAKMKERAGDKAEQLYDAACAYALCVGAAKRAKSPVPEGPGSKKLEDEAMSLLKQAVTKGFKNAAHFKQDKDIDALREREDFKKLLAELDNRSPNGKNLQPNGK